MIRQCCVSDAAQGCAAGAALEFLHFPVGTDFQRPFFVIPTEAAFFAPRSGGINSKRFAWRGGAERIASRLPLGCARGDKKKKLVPSQAGSLSHAANSHKAQAASILDLNFPLVAAECINSTAAPSARPSRVYTFGTHIMEAGTREPSEITCRAAARPDCV